MGDAPVPHLIEELEDLSGIIAGLPVEEVDERILAPEHAVVTVEIVEVEEFFLDIRGLELGDLFGISKNLSSVRAFLHIRLD